MILHSRGWRSLSRGARFTGPKVRFRALPATAERFTSSAGWRSAERSGAILQPAELLPFNFMLLYESKNSLCRRSFSDIVPFHILRRLEIRGAERSDPPTCGVASDLLFAFTQMIKQPPPSSLFDSGVNAFLVSDSVLCGSVSLPHKFKAIDNFALSKNSCSFRKHLTTLPICLNSILPSRFHVSQYHKSKEVRLCVPY